MARITDRINRRPSLDCGPKSVLIVDDEEDEAEFAPRQWRSCDVLSATMRSVTAKPYRDGCGLPFEDADVIVDQ